MFNENNRKVWVQYILISRTKKHTFGKNRVLNRFKIIISKNFRPANPMRLQDLNDFSFFCQNIINSEASKGAQKQKYNKYFINED